MKTIFPILVLGLATILSACGDRELPPIDLQFANTTWECSGANEISLGIVFRERWSFTNNQLTIDRFVKSSGALYDSNTYTWEKPEIGTLILNGTTTAKINELYEITFTAENFGSRNYYTAIQFFKQ